MSDRLNVMLEAERRGILPPDKSAILNEARRRGLVPSVQPQQEPPLPSDQPDQPVLDFIKRAGVEKRVENVEQYKKTMTPLQSAIPIAGQYAGAGLDVVGQGVKEATPQFVKDAGSAVISGAAQLAGKLPSFGGGTIGERIPQELSGLSDKYSQFKQQNPVLAANIEGAGNILAAVAPTGKAPSKSGQSLLGKTASSLEGKAVAQTALKRKDKITSLVKDELSDSDVASAIMEGRVSESRYLKKQTVELKPFEKEMVDAVEALPNIKKGDRPLTVVSGILKEAEKENLSLTKKLSKQNIQIPKDVFKAELEKHMLEFIDNSPVLVGNSRETAQKLVNEFYKILDTVENTPSGIMQARKMFDAVVEKSKPTAFDPATANAFNQSIREIRTKTNDFISNSVPNIDVKDSLKRQHLLLSAAENASFKIAKNQNDVLNRVVDVVKNAGSAKALAGTAAGVAGLGTAAFYSGALLPLAVTGGVIYAGGKALTSAQAKKLGASLLSGIDKSIKGGKMSAEALQQLKADRAIILDLIQQQEEEQQGTEQK